MNSINLLPKKNQAAGASSALQHLLVQTTTIVLVVYLVGISGLLGWWLFLATQDSLTTRKIADLQVEIRKVSTTEALIWEASRRAELIDKFLQSRADPSSLATKLIPTENVAITGYKYSVLTQSVDVKTGQLIELEKYTERIKSAFPNIINNTITNENGGGWEVNVGL